MARILVFQHVSAEPLGTLHAIIRARGHRVRFVNFDRHPDARPKIDRYRGLVVLGGPMNVQDVDRYPHLATEMRVIREAIEQGKPVLGICLGAQLLAHAHGARVWRNPVSEIGWYKIAVTEAGRSDPVLAPLADLEKVFQWHSYTFDTPNHGELLATSALCQNQAFRIGGNGYGFQFHLEVDGALVRRWLSLPDYRHELREEGQQPIEAVEANSDHYIAPMQLVANQVFHNFLDLIGRPRRRTPLPSRG